METFIEQLVSGLASGSVYACFALALVVTYKATGVVNFAQGEMGMVSTYIAWMLIQKGVPFPLACLAALPVAFAIGAFTQLAVMRPVEDDPKLNLVIITIGLLLILRSATGWWFGYDNLSFPSPFPEEALHVGKAAIAYSDLGIIGVNLLLMLMIYLFFRFTQIGLVMRGVALNTASSRLLGIRVRWVLALGWGFAGVIGAIAGMLVAPVVFLSPTMMSGIMIYALAAAILGGLESAVGAVVGGLSMGVLETMVGAWVSFIGPSLKLTVALAVIVIVLVFRPDGLFGKAAIERV